MRVLLTGATGFIGSHVARLLVRQGHEVHAVVRSRASTNRIADVLPRINIAPVDLYDLTATSAVVQRIRPEGAIHLAWYAVPGKYWTARENLDCATMTLSLAEALAESGCRRVVAAGTCAEYHWDGDLLSETTTPLRPTTLYGVCKDATRRILEAYFTPRSIGFAWARFFFLYGPGEPMERLVPSVVSALLRREEARCSAGHQVRDFLHVADAAGAVVRLLQDDARGSFNVASGVPVAVKDVIGRIADKLGRPDLVRLGARKETQPEAPFVVASTQRLQGELGWRPRFDLDAGLEDTIAWWRARAG